MAKLNFGDLVQQGGELIVPNNGNVQGAGLIPEQGIRIREAMSDPVEPWAKQNRPGRGGKVFTYISHGYVASKLNEVFGPFWSWELIPITNGRYYDVIEYDTKGKPQREVIVAGKLYIQIFDQRGVEITSITRTGEGGKVWEENTTFADAIQSASSDAFKRAAFRLGKSFGLELYYDDEERQEEYTEQLRIAAEFKMLQEHPELVPPKNIGQLLSRMNTLHISDERFREVVGCDISEVTEARVREVWDRLFKSIPQPS